MPRTATFAALASMFLCRMAMANPFNFICLVHEPEVPGLETESLRVALEIERRKGRTEAITVNAGSRDECPLPVEAGGWLAVDLGQWPVALLVNRRGDIRAVGLTRVSPRDRAQILARVVLATLITESKAGTLPLVDPEESFEPPVSATVESEESEEDREPIPGGYLSVGARYGYQPGPQLHLGLLEAEGGLSLFDDRFALGVSGTWQFSQELNGDVPGSVTAGEILLMAKGGLRWEIVLLRLGLGVGAQWRRIVARPVTRLDSLSDTDWSVVLGAELETKVRIHGPLYASLAFTLRWFWKSKGYEWKGVSLYNAPSVTVGTALRLGVTL